MAFLPGQTSKLLPVLQTLLNRPDIWKAFSEPLRQRWRPHNMLSRARLTVIAVINSGPLDSRDPLLSRPGVAFLGKLAPSKDSRVHTAREVPLCSSAPGKNWVQGSVTCQDVRLLKVPGQLASGNRTSSGPGPRRSPATGSPRAPGDTSRRQGLAWQGAPDPFPPAWPYPGGSLPSPDLGRGGPPAAC